MDNEDKFSRITPAPREEIAPPAVAGKADNPAVSYNKIEDVPYGDRQALAIEIASFYAEFQQNDAADFVIGLQALKIKFPHLYGCSGDKFTPIEGSVDKLTADKRNNIFAAFILFYIISGGKYPQEIWNGSTEKLEDTALGEVRLKGKELSVKLSNLGCKRHADAIGEVVKNYQRQTENSDIAPVLCADERVGLAKLYELFWEVFVMKYGNYKPSFWKNKISEFRDKKYAVREECEFKEESRAAEIYAVSYEGKLNKPMHHKCEDCSFVTVYDENTWLAVSADGVGSCENSYIGSQVATEMLSETISTYLQSTHILSSDKRRKAFGNKLKPVHEVTWANLMYFLRFKLAVGFYEAWEEAVKMSKEYQADTQSEIIQFTSTLQFAFGCEKFIACGRVGDGSFFVRKREKNGSGYCYGGMILDDGISGVTQTAVLTVAHLKTNPSALQVDFFNRSEVTDIIISSDGVSGALGNSVDELERLTCKLREMPFQTRCEELSRIARMCSDYNETRHGSGDDSTIVHIHLKN